MKHFNGSTSVFSPGPWQQMVAVRDCPCSDGRTRTARITGQPDTAFSVPASVSVRGKRVSGFVSLAPSYWGAREGFVFTATVSGRNGALLPPWSDDVLRTF